MSRYIVKLKDYYFSFSSIVDAPVTFGMSLDEFKEYYKSEYGQAGLMNLDGRLARVEKYGSSNMAGLTAKEVLEPNKAGPNEDSLTVEEIYKAYCLREPIRDGWLVPAPEV